MVQIKKITELAAYIGADCHLKGSDLDITGIATLQNAGSNHLSFLTNPRYRSDLKSTEAAAVLISPEDLPLCPVSALVMVDPKIGLAKIAQLFDDAPVLPAGLHPTALIHPSAVVPKSAAIGPYVVIEEGVVLGEKVSIGAGCIIGAFSSIGEESQLKPSVTLYHRVKMGARCLIHSGAVIGSDGFGLANENGRWLKVAQLGGVELGDEVEIGANTTIDRGAIENTVIATGVKIDNQVQIAHNVKIGAGTAIAAQVGIAGSTEIGRFCLLAGKVGIGGHLTVCDQVIIAGMSSVWSSIDKKGMYSSSIPVQPAIKWNRTLVRLNGLDQVMLKIKALTKKLGM